MAFSALPILFLLLLGVEALTDEKGVSKKIPLVKREDRKSLIVTENGEVSAVGIRSGIRGPYHLQFITLDPNSLFLPVLLHSDMVFFVHTGSGKLSWADDGKEIKRVNLRSGDVFRLQPGSIFFVQSNLDPQREKLRIYAIFTSAEEDTYEPSIGAYSAISDVVLGFERQLLQSAFMAPEDVIEEIRRAERPAGVVHAAAAKKSLLQELEARLVNVLTGRKDVSLSGFNSKSKKIKTFNIEEAKPDFENCNGWSVTVDKENLKTLRGSNVGVFMVNLTKGSMMGPHWNPVATEVSIVLQGQGMVRVVCASNTSESECKSVKFKVKAGDVFLVPRFHPMVQMSFNNESLVFMGFSTTTRRNYPQFLAGKRSVLQTLDNEILALSFNVSNSTIAQLLTAQTDSIILDCTSCAEEEERIMQEEIEKKRQEEEARKREEEERKRREEEEARRREEEERKREEEEARKREEEEREREREREEEEARKREEEEREREEEEREREKEEARRREEEREKEEEEARKREEEEEKRREEEEEARREEEERRRKEKEAEWEQEEARRQEEEMQKRRKEEEEAARKEREREAEGQ